MDRLDGDVAVCGGPDDCIGKRYAPMRSRSDRTKDRRNRVEKCRDQPHVTDTKKESRHTAGSRHERTPQVSVVDQTVFSLLTAHDNMTVSS